MPKGKIIAYSESVAAGIIESEGERLSFTKAYWTSEDKEPQNDQKVMFDKERDTARNIKPLS